jgi:hypothetical protein
MEWITCVDCKNFWSNFVYRTCASKAAARPVLHRLSCSKEQSKMPQNMSFRSNRVDMVHSLQKIQPRLCLAKVCVNGTCSPSFAITFVQYGNCPKGPKHEFWVQWSGSGALVANNSDATWFSEYVHYWHQFGQFGISFCAVTKRSQIPQNMNFGSNGVDQVRSFSKIS